MTFKCPLCGQVYLLDKNQVNKTFQCCFFGLGTEQCPAIIIVGFDEIGKAFVTAQVPLEVFDTVPSYTRLMPVKDLPAIPQWEEQVLPSGEITLRVKSGPKV